jgi:hypothetical protein
VSLVAVNGPLWSNYSAHIGPSRTVAGRVLSTQEGRHRPRVAPDSAIKVSQVIRPFTHSARRPDDPPRGWAPQQRWRRLRPHGGRRRSPGGRRGLAHHRRRHHGGRPAWYRWRCRPGPGDPSAHKAPRTSTDQQQQQGRHGDLPPGGLAVAGSLSIARQHGEALTWSKSRRCGRAGSPALTATIPRIRHPDASKNQITHAYHRRATRRIDSLLIIGLLEHIRGAMRVTALRMERQDFRACEPRNTGSW